MKPKVSLYIPCYNAQEYIDKCLEGILRQTYPIDEILVIDDSPTDETAEIVSRFPVTLIQRREKLGLPSARNAAFRQARNDFVAALDADSVPEPEWMERLMENFTEGNIVGVGGRLIEKYTDAIADRWREVHMKQHWGEEKITNPIFLFGSNGIFKKEALLKVGLFNEKKYRISYEDVDISLRLKREGYKLVYEPQAQVYHLRKDTILSVLETYWRWVVTERAIPDSLSNLIQRIHSNFWRSKTFIKRDFLNRRFSFLSLDFLLYFIHSFYDLKFYLSRKSCFAKESQ